MPAHEHISDMQFQYSNPDLGESKRLHQLQAFGGQTYAHLGTLIWQQGGEIRNITVASDQQRRGVGTALWDEAHSMARTNKTVPAPKHSSDRTTAGDEWARSVGGRLPRRKRDE